MTLLHTLALAVLLGLPPLLLVLASVRRTGWRSWDGRSRFVFLCRLVAFAILAFMIAFPSRAVSPGTRQIITLTLLATLGVHVWESLQEKKRMPTRRIH